MVRANGDGARPSVDRSSGAFFGRYRVLGELGAGGMGFVLAAHDPDLDRRVAIKVLRGDRPASGSKLVEHTVRLDQDGEARDLDREQLLAEARALAHVSHPNLVTVFEVGEVDGQVFLVMELVEGETLSQWLEAKRSVGEIVGAFVQAGRGLAAAHAAGLVHGDFKPENALVDRAGRVRVIDFGLARAAGVHAAGARTVGTPRYMAPEQMAGAPVDARADQFALCVALYEALYRASPFPAATGDAAPARGRLAGQAARPAERRGPRRIERVLLRGLARDPAARFASTDQLLAALERALGRARAIHMASLAFVVATASVASALVLTDAEEDPCDRADRHLAGVWDPAAAERVRAVFASSSRPHASSSYERARSNLDAYAAAWTAARRAACRAARDGEESASLIDRRVACLDGHRLRLGALVRNLARADDELVDRALEMTADLGPVDDCADGEALLAGAPPLSDPAARAELAALEPQVADAEVVLAAGRATEAERATLPLLERARALGHAPLVAAVARLRGRALEDIGRPAEAKAALFEAVQAAERAGSDPLTAAAYIDLIRVVGVRLAQRSEGRILAQTAAATLERSSTREDPRLRAALLAAEGNLETEAANFPRALELTERALALRQSILPADHPDLAVSEIHLGNALVRVARHAEGRRHLEAALALRRRVFGESHPLTATAYLNLGVADFDEGRMDDARRNYLAALTILERMPEARALSAALNNLGSVETKAGRFAEGVRYYERALENRRSRLGPDHPDVATALFNLGGAYSDMGDAARALELHRQSIDIRRRALGEDDLRYASALVAAAEDLRQLGKPGEALEQAERGLAVQVGKFGAEHRRTGFSRLVVGSALVDLGRHREAIPMLEQAVALLPETDPDRAKAQFHLARAWTATGKRTEGLALAGEARRRLAETGRQYDIAQVDAWLAGPGRR